MGSAIAGNLMKAGHTLAVYNRSAEKAEALVKQGATPADSPQSASSGAEAVFSMLADDPAAEEVAFGKRGIAAGLQKGAVHISQSTISVNMAKRLAEEHARQGQEYLSAPVFGRPDAAEAARLVIVAGGKPELVTRFKPVFESIGRAVFVAGEQPWQANLYKLCGNFMIASMMESLGETFATVRKAGADHNEFFNVMVEMFGSPVYKNYGGSIAAEKFEPAAFALKLGFKDIRLVLEASQGLNVPMPMASVLRDQFISAMANGQEDMDWSSVAKIPARNAGL